MVVYWPLTGRREELSIIERALREDQCRGLVLAGAPGVGKTRLAREALAAADAAGCETKWAAASQAVAAIPFGAVADLLPPAEEKQLTCSCCSRLGNGWSSGPQADGWYSASMTLTCSMTPRLRCSSTSSSTASPLLSQPFLLVSPRPGRSRWGSRPPG